MNLIKKILLSIISGLIGLISIPILALEFRLIEELPIMIIYLLPIYCLSLIILFEIITKIKALRSVFKFIYGFKMLYVFAGLIIIEWIIMLTIDPTNDVVFASQFASGIIPAIIIYARLGINWNIFSSIVTNNAHNRVDGSASVN